LLPNRNSFVRVLGDLEPEPQGEVDDNVVIEALKKLAPLRKKKCNASCGNQWCIFRHKRLCELLDNVASDAVAALWDVHHPYRFAGETPGKTVQILEHTLNMYISRTRLLKTEKIHYRMLGEGDLPIDDIMMALRSINYEGYISLEWVKRWLRTSTMPELSSPICKLHEPLH